MSDLKQMMKNKFEDDRGLELRVALKAGYKDASSLSRFVNDPTRDMDDFSKLIIIVRELFEDEEFKVMSNYIKTLDPNKKAARYALEYASVNGLSELKNHMINKLNAPSMNVESKEWAKIYSEDDKVSSQSTINTLQELGAMNLKKTEPRIFRELLQFYVAYELKMFDLMFEISELINAGVKKVKDPFIKASFLGRLGLALCSVNLYKGRVDTARLNGFSVVNGENRTPRIDCLAYLNLGNSYIFENYEKSLELLNKGLEISKDCSENALNETKRSINFLQNVWNKKPEFLNYNSDCLEDIQEVIVYMINQNQLEEATKLYKSIENGDYNNYQKAFNDYIGYRLSQEKAKLFSSIKNFKLAGDAFFIQLPIIQLKNLGYEEEMIDLLLI